MNSKDLNEIAKVHVDTILAQELTRAEAIMVVALIQARIVSAVSGVAPTTLPLVKDSFITEGMAPKPKIGVIAGTAPMPESIPMRKSVPYDPETDPAPDIQIVEPPPREDLKGKQLAPNNKACICSKCEVIAYVTNRPIIDGMKIGDFIEAFTPGEGLQPLSRKTTIKNIDGNISVDCPNCKGEKTVYLVGKKPHSTGGVSSIVSV